MRIARVTEDCTLAAPEIKGELSLFRCDVLLCNTTHSLITHACSARTPQSLTQTHSSRMSLGSLGLALPRACLPTHTRASRPASTKPASTSLTTWSASAVVGGKFAAAGTHFKDPAPRAT